nr:hypothetical protein [Tanacetum cinerariifolium]
MALNESKDDERHALNESKDCEKNGRVFLNLYLTQNSTAPNYRTNTTKIKDSLQNRAKLLYNSIEAFKMALVGSPPKATDERCKSGAFKRIVQEYEIHERLVGLKDNELVSFNCKFFDIVG